MKDGETVPDCPCGRPESGFTGTADDDPVYAKAGPKNFLKILLTNRRR